MSRWNDVQAESGSDDDWEVWCGDYGHPGTTFHTTQLFSFSNTQPFLLFYVMGIIFVADRR